MPHILRVRWLFSNSVWILGADLFFSCSVLVMPSGFWVFMYRVSPFTYLVSAMMSVGIAHAPVYCAPKELRVFDPPDGMTCGAYLEEFISSAGGRLLNGEATSQCEYCQFDSTDGFLATINADYGNRWRDLGILFVFIAFNVVVAVFLYWLMRVPRGEKKVEVAATDPVLDAKRQHEDGNRVPAEKPVVRAVVALGAPAASRKPAS